MDIILNDIILLNNVVTIVDLDFFKILNKHDTIKGIKLNEKLLLDLNFRKQINWEYNGTGTKKKKNRTILFRYST
jgi:hypothetical protein